LFQSVFFVKSKRLAMSSPILTTKLFIPTIRSGIVPRPKLIQKLNAGRENNLILVSAPAGYGKTTLLAEWISQQVIPLFVPESIEEIMMCWKKINICEGCVVLLLLLVLLLNAGCGRVPSDLSTEERINRVENSLLLNKSIYDRMEYHSVPGMSIAVINDFEIEWAKGYGVMELGKDDHLVTPDTLFQAGSVAKPVTAITALHFVDQDLLDLDENVNHRLVSWQIPENEYTAQGDVTLRRLLSHTAGINQGLNAGYAPGEEVPALLQSLEGVYPANTLPVRVDRIPGTECYYSNGGYLVVVQLLEDVTGKSFTEITHEAVFGPLNMTSSTYQQMLPEELAARTATPHGWDVIEWQEVPGLVGEIHIHDPGYGGLWTTAPDLAKLGVEIMQTHAGNSEKILTQEMVLQMTATLAEDVPMQAPFNVDQGLGFNLWHLGGNTWFIHFGGSFPGYISVLLLQPERGFGVAILTNSFTGYELIWEILYSLFYGYGILPTTGQLLGIGYSLLLVVAAFLFWLRSSSTQKVKSKVATIATILIMLTAIAILVLMLRFWGPWGGYQVHPLWKGESVLNKALLGIFFSTPVFLLAMLLLIWRKQSWSFRERVYYTLMVVGALLGIFLLRDLWPLMFWG
jgi:CubicO group peptidase (beta-lactamase class C family)